jgi:electron transport complex protein RnfG
MIAPAERSQTSAWEMYRAIVGIGALCALVIVGVFQGTAARIRENQERFLADAIAEVLPAAATTSLLAFDGQERLTLTDSGPALPVILGLDEDGQLVGAAIEGAGMGYQDTIRVLYAYSFADKAIVGMKVLETKETPGLGDKIESEPHFIANFESLDVRLDDAGIALQNPIVTVKQGEKTEAWQIDGITGATITSEAIGNIMNESAGTWVPILERDAEKLAAEVQR